MENEKLYTLITGASAGIGKQLAIECAKRGYNLFLVALPNTGLEVFSAEIVQNYSVDVQYFSIDLTEYNSPKKVFEFVENNKMKIKILINNAGVGFNGKIETLSHEMIDQMILLNIRTSTLLIFLFLPEMKKLNKAYILNISSFAAFTPLQYKCVYAATKTYLLYLTRAMNLELKGTNVSATSVHPSGVSSKRSADNIKNSSFFARISALKPERVAEIALRNMLSEKKIVIPGLMTKFYYYLGSVLPHGLVIRLVGYIFRKTA